MGMHFLSPDRTLYRPCRRLNQRLLALLDVGRLHAMKPRRLEHFSTFE